MQPDDDDTYNRHDLDARFRRPLLSYFLKRVRIRADAEDLTQEVLVRLAAHPDRRGGGTLEAYVFTIASNLLRDRLRAERVRQMAAHHPLDADEELSDPALIEDRSPQRVLLAKETLQETLIALAELSERTRDIFILARIERMPHRDIASLFGISVSAVEKHVIKALAHIVSRSQRR